MKKILSMIILIILPLICLAEQYTLEELVNIGLENSYDIQKEMVSKKNSTSLLRSSIYGVLPTVTAGVERLKYYDQIYEPNETDLEQQRLSHIVQKFFPE